MKEKEPNKTFFSADEIPVSLPSVEEAWSDMRKKLDEERPERAVFFTWKRMGLLLGLLFLSVGAFWFIERHGTTARPAAERSVGVADPTKTRSRSGMNHQGVASNRPAETDRQDEANRRTDVDHRVEVNPHAEAIHRAETNPQVGVTQRAETNGLNKERKVVSQTGLGRDETRQREKGGEWLQKEEKKMGGGQINGRRTVINTDLPRIKMPDPIQVWVNIPRRAAGIPRIGAGKENKNAKKPEEPKTTAKGDSTRILWAAGLQDSKSFPVGAQQPVDYNANLKKDLWFDYVPSPYFQYFISRKIGFQFALQFNSPQYTESVSIYKAPVSGVPPGQFVDDTVVVVRKLYYLSLPLIAYYSPLKNLYLGAGVQFSSLSNGVAFQNNVSHFIGIGPTQPDSVKATKLIALKDNRPAYNNLKKTDWRALFEVNYYWKRIAVGAQYQQGLSNYLYTPVDGSTGKDRNSSFNIFLRYNIWERRVKIAPKN